MVTDPLVSYANRLGLSETVEMQTLHGNISRTDLEQLDLLKTRMTAYRILGECAVNKKADANRPDATMALDLLYAAILVEKRLFHYLKGTLEDVIAYATNMATVWRENTLYIEVIRECDRILQMIPV